GGTSELDLVGLSGPSVTVADTGALPALTLDTGLAVDLGANPLVVSTNTVLTELDFEDITGLHVAAGATATFPADFFANLDGDCHIEGTAVGSGSFNLRCQDLLADAGSTVRVPGGSIEVAS